MIYSNNMSKDKTNQKGETKRRGQSAINCFSSSHYLPTWKSTENDKMLQI